MSRRDTVIVAVLINACLLIVLFATSISKKDSMPIVAKETSSQPLNVPKVQAQDIQRAVAQESSFAIAQAKLNEPSVLPKVEKKVVEPKAPPKLVTKKEPVEKAAPSYVQVTVKRGDYLEKLARENNTKVDEIMRLNQLNSTQLKIGQVLKMPALAKKSNSKTEDKPALKQYVVKSGDTLWHIAKKHNMQVSDLLKINRMSSDSANRLQPGDTLLVH